MSSLYIKYPAGQGVLSVNSLTGAITLAAGTGITLTPAGNTITIAATDLANSLTSAHLFVGNVSNIPTDVAVSGDLTLVNTGAFTVASIQGTTVSGVTGTGNVAFSASPTFTGTINAAALLPKSASGVGALNANIGFTVTPASMTTALTTTNAEGFSVEGAFPATATNSVTSFNANATTTASAYTLGTLQQFVSNNVAAGAGSTITRSIAYRVVQPTGGTNNAAFADNAAFTGSYFINQSGSTASNMVGNLQHGGTATNDSAAAGQVGEFVTSFVASTVFPTTNQFGDLTSISLTAGDWNVCISGECQLNASTTTEISVGVSTTTGNSATGLTNGDTLIDVVPPGATYNSGFSLPLVRASLSGTTTYYFKIFATYSAGTPKVRGRISARRMR